MASSRERERSKWRRQNSAQEPTAFVASLGTAAAQRLRRCADLARAGKANDVIQLSDVS